MVSDEGGKVPLCMRLLFGFVLFTHFPSSEPRVVSIHYSEAQGPLLELFEMINTNKSM